MGIGELTVSRSKIVFAVTFPGGGNEENMNMVIFRERTFSRVHFPLDASNPDR